MAADKTEELAKRFEQTVRRPVVSVEQAAHLVGRSISGIRAEIYAGTLTGSRAAPNGPIHITCTELARWFIAGTRHSLPVARSVDR